MTNDRDSYLTAPLPIERELSLLFDLDAQITIFDIGACEGEDAVRYAKLFPHASVFAVEPVPKNLERIHATLARYGATDVRVLPFALSDTSTVETMYVSSGSPPGHSSTEDWDYGNKSSSLLSPDAHLAVHPWVRFDSTIDVQTRRLDEVCLEQGIARLDFIHMDVQGAELMVLEGAGERLADLTGIWLEVEAVPLYRGQPLQSDVQVYLESQGFTLVKDTVGDISGDQLWIRGTLRGTLRRRVRMVMRAWSRRIRLALEPDGRHRPSA